MSASTQTFNTIKEAAIELQSQLSDKNWYYHNIQLLDQISNYLNNSTHDKNDKDEELNQIEIYLTDDLAWGDNFEDFFPMEL